MHLYGNLMILGLVGVLLAAYLSFQVVSPKVTFLTTALVYLLVLLTTFLLTKKEFEERYTALLGRIKRAYNQKIRKLRREHDTTMLERTIRNGTKTLIKNAVDYFKIDNIKNEMGASAAIQNLQLDKYGQIIELLADFSLILPDHEENRRIVLQEIQHQIAIYQFDERAFAGFLERITEKYQVSFNKKLRERREQTGQDRMKNCPRCAERVQARARGCRHCGHVFVPSLAPVRGACLAIARDASLAAAPGGSASGAASGAPRPEWIDRGHALFQNGKYQEAIDVFTKAIGEDPDAHHAYYNRGIVFLKMDQDARAFEDFSASARMGNQRARRVLEALRMMKTQETFGPGTA